MGQLPLTHKNALNYDLYEEVKQEWKGNKKSPQVIGKMISMLAESTVPTIAHDSIIRYLHEASQHCTNVQSNYIYQLLESIIHFEIDNCHGSSNQLYDLSVLKNCFYEMYRFCHEAFYSGLWEKMSLVPNKQLLHETCIKYFHYKCENEVRVEHLLKVYERITSHHLLSCGTQDQILMDVHGILIQFVLPNNELVSLIDVVLNSLSHETERVTEFMVIETQIIPNLLKFLSDKHQNDEIISKLLYITGKLFSVDDSLCEQMHFQILSIMGDIRQKLPVPPLPIGQLPTLTYKQLLHQSAIITNHALFALSNIFASGVNFVALALNSDIYRCLIAMYPLINQPCRVELSHCIYSVVCNCPFQMFQIILEMKFLDIIDQMLKEQSLELVVKALKTLEESLRLVAREKEQTKLVWMTNIVSLSKQIQESGIKTQVEGFLYHQNKQISQLAEQLLQILVEHENS